jgi:hypothetical protein
MSDSRILRFFSDGDGDFAAEFLKILRSISTGLKYLGVGDAGTTMGAVEFLGVEIGKGFARLADAQREAAEIIAFALTESAQIIADALRSKAAPPRNVAAEPHADEADAEHERERELRRGVS